MRSGLSGLYSRDNLSRLSKAEPLRALLSFVLRLDQLEHHFQKKTKSKNVPLESQRENYTGFGEGNFLAEASAEEPRFKKSTSEVREDFSAPTSQNDSPRAKAGVETGRVDPWITVPGLSCL